MKLLRLVPETTNFPFMRFRRISYPFSAFISIVSVLLFIFVGMNFGIDFSGGTLMEIRAKQGAADLADLRTLGQRLNLGDVEVQGFGTEADVTLRFGTQPGGDVAQQEAVNSVRTAIENNYEIRRVEVVGPRVSAELVQAGTLGIVLAILAVLVYLWFRFEWQFAIAAIIATMHDLLITVGFFSITQLEFNTTSIAAILTIVGYSLNETVVVLDRIREMLRKYKRMPMPELIDVSINAVIPRTIMTVTTILLALFSLAIFGGHVISSFTFAMIFGVFMSTYSSVFICSPILIYLGLHNDKALAEASEAEANEKSARKGANPGSTKAVGRPSAKPAAKPA